MRGPTSPAKNETRRFSRLIGKFYIGLGVLKPENYDFIIFESYDLLVFWFQNFRKIEMPSRGSLMTPHLFPKVPEPQTPYFLF